MIEKYPSIIDTLSEQNRSTVQFVNMMFPPITHTISRSLQPCPQDFYQVKSSDYICSRKSLNILFLFGKPVMKCFIKTYRSHPGFVPFVLHPSPVMFHRMSVCGKLQLTLTYSSYSAVIRKIVRGYTTNRPSYFENFGYCNDRVGKNRLIKVYVILS